MAEKINSSYVRSVLRVDSAHADDGERDLGGLGEFGTNTCGGDETVSCLMAGATENGRWPFAVGQQPRLDLVAFAGNPY